MKRIAITRLGQASAAAVVLLSRTSWAGDFDDTGRLSPTEVATYFETFEEPVRYFAEGEPPECAPPGYEVIADEAAALEGGTYVRVDTADDCAERFELTVHDGQGAYSASIWLRHGSAGARFIVKYPDEIGGEQLTARLAPTGRATSDGGIELASDPLPSGMSEDRIASMRA